ncbi:MAG: hypothetical protein LBN43_09585 [Oscillospiraceae bacterium]|jgi:quercetin dioxygenase-like cupin family protein|nr:hypothetical protein [Oscillospiraceae bacterium]
MKNEYVIDLNDRASSWIYPVEVKMPDGRVAEEQSTIVLPEGADRTFLVTASIMKKIPDGANPDESNMAHEHLVGYETFFIDSGKMWVYMDGKKALAKAGDILHLQANQAHGMAFLEDTKYRLIAHNLSSCDDAAYSTKLKDKMPELAEDPEFMKARPAADFSFRERPVFKEVPIEQFAPVRNPSRPLAEYKFDGATVKVLIERWENAGVTELAMAELEPGFSAEWVKFPKYRELLYVRSGEVKFTVYNDEFTVHGECLVNIPKFAPHKLTAIKKSEVYDVGGLSRWSAFLQDYTSIKTYDPARLENPETLETLRNRFGVNVKSISYKA